MPIYEYRCESCGLVSEFLAHSWDESESPRCPNCGSHSLDRLLSTPALLKEKANPPGSTCCGRTERCETPPCSTGEQCRRR